MRKLIAIAQTAFRDIRPTECGTEVCAPYHKLGPTYRDYFLLHYVFAGRGTYQAGGQTHNVTKGQMFIIHPRDVVTYQSDSDDPWHYGWVGFHTALELPQLAGQYVLDVPFAEHIFRAIVTANTITRGREYYVCGKLYELISMLVQREEPVAGRSTALVEQAASYLRANFHLPVSMDQLAEELYISRSYLSTVFRKYMGVSPREYLIDIRLEHAAELIVKHGYSIGGAAVSSGYTDIYNFSRMFKKKFGLSPSLYRETQKARGLPLSTSFLEPVDIV